MIVYHGSPTPNIKILEPKLDPRLEISGVFVSDEKWGPMLFALLDDRANANVNYSTRQGKFVSGEVITKKINDKGWLYILDVAESEISKDEDGRTYLTKSVEVSGCEMVSVHEILGLGWVVKIKEQ